MVDFGKFSGPLGALGAPVARSEANSDTSAPKRGAAYFSLSSFGQKKWVRKLSGKFLEELKIGPRSPEEEQRGYVKRK